MFDETDDASRSVELEVPGAKLLGSQILYPFDFVSQSEDVFPPPHFSDSRPFSRSTAPQKKPLLTGVARLFGVVFLFVACLAFPFMIPLVYALRRSRHR